MTDAEKKLKQLQSCIGEKKLKQLGLIPCSTCRKIMTQVMNISLPTHLQNKPFFTSEEMSTISQTILESINCSLNDLSYNKSVEENIQHTNQEQTSLNNPSAEDTLSSKSSSIEQPKEENTTEKNNDEATHTQDNSSNNDVTEDATITYSLGSEEDLVNKLLSILNQSQHLTQGDLGIGYIYTPPIVSPFTHTLNCTECGHMYTISTQPTLKLIPLPVYLTDTEYEMIKGIYVDILL